MNAESKTALTTFTFRVWVRSGPRDRTNALNNWGKRTITVEAPDAREAVYKMLDIAGPLGYGGMIY